MFSNTDVLSTPVGSLGCPVDDAGRLPSSDRGPPVDRTNTDRSAAAAASERVGVSLVLKTSLETKHAGTFEGEGGGGGGKAMSVKIQNMYTRLQTVWSLPGHSRQANKGHSPLCHRRPNGPGRLADKVVQPTTQSAEGCTIHNICL